MLIALSEVDICRLKHRIDYLADCQLVFTQNINFGYASASVRFQLGVKIVARCFSFTNFEHSAQFGLIYQLCWLKMPYLRYSAFKTSLYPLVTQQLILIPFIFDSGTYYFLLSSWQSLLLGVIFDWLSIIRLISGL